MNDIDIIQRMMRTYRSLGMRMFTRRMIDQNKRIYNIYSGNEMQASMYKTDKNDWYIQLFDDTTEITLTNPSLEKIMYSIKLINTPNATAFIEKYQHTA